MFNVAKEVDRLKKGFRALRLYRRCVRPGYLCFDIGANHGSRAVIFTLLGARTIAVEPNATLTTKLRRFPRITVVNKAVSDQPGQQQMLFNANDQISSLNPAWRSQWPDFPDWSERTIECVTLDQLIAQHGLPDFCKIDVEGYEPAVLRGLSQPIPMLSFEASPGFQANTAACLNHLASLGDYEFNFAIGDDFVWLQSQWVEVREALEFVRGQPGDIYARLRKAHSLKPDGTVPKNGLLGPA